MTKQDGDTRKLLISEIKRLLFTLRPTMPAPTEMLVQGYIDALDDLRAPEIQVMVREALRTKWDFVPPTPGELRDLVLKLRDEQASQAGSKYRYRNVTEKHYLTGKDITVRVYDDGYKGYRAMDCPEGIEFLATMNRMREEYNK
jgi:hypothetical protein